MSSNTIPTIAALLSFAFGLVWLRAAAEAQGLVEIYILRQPLQNPDEPVAFLVFGLLFIVASLLCLACLRPVR